MLSRVGHRHAWPQQRPTTLARNALDVQKLALRAHFDTEDVNIALGASENTTALKNTEMAHRCPSGPDASFPTTRTPADCMPGQYGQAICRRPKLVAWGIRIDWG